MSPGPAAGPRTIETTGFTAILDELLGTVPDAKCAVFVDDEGETIDLASHIDPFEARIAGAEMALPLATARASFERAGLGPLVELRFSGTHGAALARSVGDGCFLVVVTRESLSALSISRCAIAADALRVEAGFRSTSVLRPLKVLESRTLASGRSVPAVIEEAGVRRGVEVLGLRNDPQRVTVLMRMGDEEFVAVFDRQDPRWRRG